MAKMTEAERERHRIGSAAAQSRYNGGNLHRPDDPNEPLSEKKKALIKAAQQQEMIRKMQEKAGIKPKPKSYAKGGKVRGCGIAQRGLSKGTMR